MGWAELASFEQPTTNLKLSFFPLWCVCSKAVCVYLLAFVAYQFVSVPPSLLTGASLCDAIAHLAADQLETCRTRLAQLIRVEQVCSAWLDV